ncbi:MAG: O-antigen translocase [Oceanospirillales bacterium]|nr:O-antigen translocase [Oceanospirillales bacterium]MBR9889851.1 O-antigen translocase [Oceanospirillales bacterium]
MNENSSHKQILRSSAVIGGASLLDILIGLIRVKVVAVLLGPAGVGLLGILQNFMSTVSTVSALGVENVGTRQISEAQGRGDLSAVGIARRALFWGTLVLSVLGALVFWLCSSYVAKYAMGSEEFSGSVSWIALGVALSVAASYQRALLTGTRRIGDIAKISVSSSIISTAIGLSIIYWFKADGIILLIIIGPLIGFIISQIYVARIPHIDIPSSSFMQLSVQWRTLVTLGSAFMVAGLVFLLGQLLVRTMVQQKLSPESLGYFQAAWSISMTYIGFVLSAMGTDYYPRLTQAIHDRIKVNRLVNEQTEVAILLAGPVLLGMLAFSPWVIQLLYTDEFRPAVTILRWQILGDVLKIIAWPMGFVILAAGKGAIFMFKEVVVISVFVLVVWVLLPYIHIESTGIAFFVMYIVNIPLLIIITRGITGFSWNKRVKKDIVILIIIALLISALGHYSDFLGAVIGGGVTLGFSISSLLRLSLMVDVGGPVAKLTNKICQKFLRVRG